MRVGLAYLFVVLLWSTTPLAIKWSGEGFSWLFGVSMRMTLGWLCTLVLLLLLRQPWSWQPRARRAYGAGALQIYGAMLSVHWAAQFIPSGWVSVIFGLTPLITAVLAAWCLAERSLTFFKITAYLLGLGGLVVMFGSAFALNAQAEWGVLGVLLSAALQSASGVGLKRVNANLPALHTVAGSLTLSVPAYWLTWGWLDGQWPLDLPVRSSAAVAYLGLIATPFGFAAYFYVLKHLPATRVMLITLATPLLSLCLGRYFNHEPWSWQVVGGAALIVSALLLYQLDEIIGIKKPPDRKV